MSLHFSMMTYISFFETFVKIFAIAIIYLILPIFFEEQIRTLDL